MQDITIRVDKDNEVIQFELPFDILKNKLLELKFILSIQDEQLFYNYDAKIIKLFFHNLKKEITKLGRVKKIEKK